MYGTLAVTAALAAVWFSVVGVNDGPGSWHRVTVLGVLTQ